MTTGKGSETAQRDPVYLRQVDLAFSWFYFDALKGDVTRRFGIEEKIVLEFRKLLNDSGLAVESKVETIRLISDEYEQTWSADQDDAQHAAALSYHERMWNAMGQSSGR